ncbi:MAG TPA: hypothetical protein VFA11_05730 [Acidimicrobiales bacterium]|nr:hypothetical protein [Acidimicrobiales bacterium]
MSEPDERARDALAHLRSAMLELVGAARAALDVVEEVVSEPEHLTNLVASLAELGRLFASAPRPGGTPAAEEPEAPPHRSGVERIRLS